MKVLGIDTTFLNSSASVVEDGRRVFSNIIFRCQGASIKELFKLPIFHSRNINLVIKKALIQARIKPKDISLVAVSNSGSLFSTISVGVEAANIFAQKYNIPLIGIDHQEAHLFSNWIGRNPLIFSYPILSFSSSGATSNISLLKNQSELKTIIQVKPGEKDNPFLGIGTIFTFLSHQLELGRGAGSGSLISKFSPKGNPARFRFELPRSRKYGDLDFSWMKKEILMIMEEAEKTGEDTSSGRFVADLCASFEKNISEILARNLLHFSERYKTKEIHLSGGISANKTVERTLKSRARRMKIQARCPVKLEYCTDNAAMIASRGYYLYKKNPRKYFSQRKIKAKSDLRLEKIAAFQAKSSKN